MPVGQFGDSPKCRGTARARTATVNSFDGAMARSGFSFMAMIARRFAASTVYDRWCWLDWLIDSTLLDLEQMYTPTGYRAGGLDSSPEFGPPGARNPLPRQHATSPRTSPPNRPVASFDS